MIINGITKKVITYICEYKRASKLDTLSQE